MKKKVIVCLLTASLAFTMLAGCGKEKTEDNTTQEVTAVEETAEENTAEEEAETETEEMEIQETEEQAENESEGPAQNTSDKWSAEENGAKFNALKGDLYSEVNFYVLPGDAGYCNQGVYKDDESLSCYEINMVGENNNTLHFLMNAPTDLAQQITLQGEYLLMMATDQDYALMGTPVTRDDDWEQFGTYEQEEIIDIIGGILGVPVGENYYYKTSDSHHCQIILDLTMGESKGYGCFVDDYETGILNTFFVTDYSEESAPEREEQIQKMFQSLTLQDGDADPKLMSFYLD